VDGFVHTGTRFRHAVLYADWEVGKGLVLQAAQFLATMCTGLFAGAALYVNLAEHPARMSRATRVAAEVWAPSYERATRMQAPLAVVSFLAALIAWFFGGGAVWLAAGVLIGIVVPFTLVVIMPTNRQLLTPGRDLASDETRTLLVRWGRLHAVRSVLALLAMALMVRSLSGI
jgi:hypothetical protein